MYTLELTNTEELEALIDALAKGASRHKSYAKFKPESRAADRHERAATVMCRLQRKLLVQRN